MYTPADTIGIPVQTPKPMPREPTHGMSIMTTRKIIYTRRTFGGKPYQLVSVVQEAEIWAQLDRGEDIEFIEVVDKGQVYYAIYTACIPSNSCDAMTY